MSSKNQISQWTEFLSCPICCNVFSESTHRPISLSCGHTICKTCLIKLQQKKCPFDQNSIDLEPEDLPINFALLQLVGVVVKETEDEAGDQEDVGHLDSEGINLRQNIKFYKSSRQCIEQLSEYLNPGANGTCCLSRPMQRKLMTLISCQLIEEDGRCRAMRAARSLVERSLTELILQHQNPGQLSSNLWAAVRARGCQFLGPGMQEEVLKLILLALEDGSALSRKVLVLFVVQRLETQYPQASKTAIGHVVQLLYRASCFKVTKREEESSLMQLKEEFRNYDALRREHDAQVIQIATEAGLRIAPDQWSSLLYGDQLHKSHMQSIIDKLQTPQSLSQGITELLNILQRVGDPQDLARLTPHLELIADIDPSPDVPPPLWMNLEAVMKAVKTIVSTLVDFTTAAQQQRQEAPSVGNSRYKTNMCRDLFQRNSCPRGSNCTFAHTEAEMERYRAKNKKTVAPSSPAGHSKRISESASASSGGFGKQSGLSKMLQRESGMPANRPKIVRTCPPADAMMSQNCQNMLFSTSLPTSHIQQQSLYTSPISVPVDRTRRSLTQKPRVSSFELPSHLESQFESDCSDVEQNSHTESDNGHFGSYEDSLPSPRYNYSAMNPVVYEQQPILPAVQVAPPQVYGKTVTLPPNPYTGHHVQGKSASQTLDELYKRRTELVAQLNKTKLVVAPSAGGMKKPSSFAHGTHAATLADIKNPTSMNLSMSAADSLATTHVTASLAKHEAKAKPTASNKKAMMMNNIENRNQPQEVSEVLASLPDSSATFDTSWITEKSHPSDHRVKISQPSEVFHVNTHHYQSPMATVSEHCDLENRSVSLGKPDLLAHGDGDHVQASNPLLKCDQPLSATVREKEILSTMGDGDAAAADTASNDTTEYVRYTVSDISVEDEEYARPEETDDEFVPFMHTIVSKFGPISRTIKARVKQVEPVQVTAVQSQGKTVTPVTAVTPIGRPFPITSPVPSRFTLEPAIGALPDPLMMQNYSGGGRPHTMQATPSMYHNSMMHPLGQTVASSLATAHMKIPLVPSAGPAAPTEPYTLWAMRDRIGSVSQHKSSSECEQIRTELARIGKQIENLQASEDGRLARELQAVELSIRETERQMHMPLETSSTMLEIQLRHLEEEMNIQRIEMDNQVQIHQEMLEAHHRKQEQVYQEKLDRHMAERIAMDEVRQQRASIVTSRDGGVNVYNPVVYMKRP